MQRVPRIELMRFALLVTLTIGLASVAFRIGDHSASHRRAGPPGRAGHSTTASPGAPGPASPSVLPTSSTRPPRSSPRTAGHTGQAGTGVVPAAVSRPRLPVTGGEAPARLTGVALVLVAGGALLVRVAGPPRRTVPLR